MKFYAIAIHVNDEDYQSRDYDVTGSLYPVHLSKTLQREIINALAEVLDVDEEKAQALVHEYYADEHNHMSEDINLCTDIINVPGEHPKAVVVRTRACEYEVTVHSCFVEIADGASAEKE